MPVLALAEARRRGFPVDGENFQAQLKWTADHLRRGRENYLQGKGQGGRGDTAGYALWALDAGGWKADEVTAAVAHYLLVKDEDADHWRRSGNRPPSEASDVTTTAVALYGLRAYGTGEQSGRIDQRRKKARAWLEAAEPRDTEDRVFRLLGLYYLDAEEKTIQAAVKQLVATQDDDGGWAQNDKLPADAYATGTALAALHHAGGMSTGERVYRRGLKFLLRGQEEDGSWHVASRSKPFQKYFESGFPHGKDQFISASASCWATIALLYACPTAESVVEDESAK